MLAYVIERSNSFAIANQDYRLVQDFDGEDISMLGELAHMTGILPPAGKYVVAVEKMPVRFSVAS